MDPNAAIRSVENALRDILAKLGREAFGPDWVDKCGLPPEKIRKWRETREEEEARLGKSDPRLLYYSQFYDLEAVCKKLWQHGAKDVFGNQKELCVLLGLLNDYRNPNAHSRSFSPYELDLINGISGKIRTAITQFMSSLETGEGHYPRLERVVDTLGNSWSIGERKDVFTGDTLRVGSFLELDFSATDPKGGNLLFTSNLGVYEGGIEVDWSDKNSISFEITENMVREILTICVAVKSDRDFQATSWVPFGKVDDYVNFHYRVPPPY